MSSLHLRRGRKCNRKGTALVEFAFVFPVFILCILALFEFGHALMISNWLNLVAKEAAHLGSFDGTESSEVVEFAGQKLQAVIGSNQADIKILDAQSCESGVGNNGQLALDGLPPVDLSKTESRQLFLVEIQVAYDDVALLPTSWMSGVILRGASMMRRE